MLIVAKRRHNDVVMELIGHGHHVLDLLVSHQAGAGGDVAHQRQHVRACRWLDDHRRTFAGTTTLDHFQRAGLGGIAPEVAETLEGAKLGVGGTPTFVVGRTNATAVEGPMIVGALPYSLFDSALKLLLEKESK